MPIALRCPKCSDVQFIDEDARHETVPCNGCDATLRVPRSQMSAPPMSEPLPLFSNEPNREPPAFSDNPFAERAPVASGKALETANPYQSPQTVDQFATASGVGRKFGYGRDPRLASRWKRLFGAIIDSLFYMAAMFVGIALSAMAQDEDVMIVSMYGLMLFAAIINAVLVVYHGQTVGKMLVGTRILVADTDELPGFARGVLMRGVLPSVIGWIPLVGGIFSLVDVLTIFGDDKRCLHDLMAGTKVIDNNLALLYRHQDNSAYDKLLRR